MKDAVERKTVIFDQQDPSMTRPEYSKVIKKKKIHVEWPRGDLDNAERYFLRIYLESLVYAAPTHFCFFQKKRHSLAWSPSKKGCTKELNLDNG